MSKERLSKLQKIIITTLKVKDKIDQKEFYDISRPNLKPPYWHRVRDEYAGGGIIVEVGIKNVVKKKFEELFDASFSRSIKGLANKGLIEVRRSFCNEEKYVSDIKLTKNP